MARSTLMSNSRGIRGAIIIKAENKADAVLEEYNELELKYGRRDVDWTFEKQALKRIDGIFYDEITITLKTGEKKFVAFDISSFYGKS
jgi:hypothetical protein